MRMRRLTACFRSSSRDEIAMGITYKQSKEIGAHKDDRATKRRRKEDTLCHFSCIALCMSSLA